MLSAVVGLVVCCGGPVAAFAVFETMKASHAAESPTVAVRWVIDSLEDEERDPRLILCLDDGREGELLAELDAIREKLAKADDFTLTMGTWEKTEDVDGVTVGVDVSIVHTIYDSGRWSFAESSAVRWTFHTIDDQGLFTTSKGWKVDRIDIPDVCEMFVDCDR